MSTRPFAELAELNQGETPDAVLTEFNAKYFVVNENGRAIVYAPKQDVQLNRSYHERITFADLRQLYQNRKVFLGLDDKRKPILQNVAAYWLGHVKRKQFLDGVLFDPSCRDQPGVLNLWQGFAVKPKSGTWALLRDHTRNVICGGNTEHFNYLMGWLARLVQHPGEPGEVAVVMRGGEGTGKGTIARAVKHLFGQHGLAISNGKHLTGNFNHHLLDCVFLFADEAFFAGDRQHVGVLKALITEPYHTIEAKYQNAHQAPNFVHLLMASNEEWVVPAALDSRRFFVLEVDDAHANDTPYFAAIWQQMESGGYEAMLHELLHYNLAEFNVRRVPTTDGLQTQRKLTLGTSESWWLDVLQRGYVFQSKLGLGEIFCEWMQSVTTELLFTSYSAFAFEKRERHPMSRETFGRFITDMGGQARRLSDAPIGEHRTDVDTAQGYTRLTAKPLVKSRPHGYFIGPINRARENFTKATGLTVAWSGADAVDGIIEEVAA